MKVAYFTPNTFATVNAGALRNVGVAQALRSVGHDVHILTTDPRETQPDPDWREIIGGDRISVQARGLAGPRQRLTAKAYRSLAGGFPKVGDIVDEVKPDAILLYDSNIGSILRLRHQAERRLLPLALDLTEWHSPFNGSPPTRWPLGLLGELSMRRFAPQVPRAIVISTRMQRHFARHGTPAIVVPPLFALGSLENRSRPTGPTRLIAVGSDFDATGKDGLGLGLVLRALSGMGVEASNYSVDVVGPISEGEAARFCAYPGVHITFHGSISRRDALRLVEEADFSVALRSAENRRMAYGFPSKVPESLLLGTPVLANRFSDLSSHLIEGANAVLVDDFSVESIASAIRRCRANFDREAIAREAHARYSPEAWGQRLSAFLGFPV